LGVAHSGQPPEHDLVVGQVLDGHGREVVGDHGRVHTAPAACVVAIARNVVSGGMAHKPRDTSYAKSTSSGTTRSLSSYSTSIRQNSRTNFFTFVRLSSCSRRDDRPPTTPIGNRATGQGVMPVVPVRERLSCRPRASSQTVLLKSVLALMELL